MTMKRSSVAAWVIIAIIILGIIIWVGTQSKDDQPSELSSRDEKVRSTFLDKISARIQHVQIEITTQIESLKLTLEMQQYLDRKFNRILIMIKLIAGVLILSAIAVLILNGVEFWAAIMTVSSFVCLGVPVLTFFFFKKIMDVTQLMDWVFRKVKNMIYRKFGCDSETIDSMRSDITAKQIAIDVLQREIVINN
jgi:hypothetical protein